jgi:hypothetical protein
MYYVDDQEQADVPDDNSETVARDAADDDTVAVTSNKVVPREVACPFVVDELVAVVAAVYKVGDVAFFDADDDPVVRFDALFDAVTVGIHLAEATGMVAMVQVFGLCCWIVSR